MSSCASQPALAPGSAPGTAPGSDPGSTSNPQTDSSTHQPIPDPINLLKALVDHERTAESLSVEERQALGDHLTLEGFTVAEIARRLGVCSRTILRDRQHVRATRAVFNDDQSFTPQMVGEFLRQTDHSLAQLRRLTRNPHLSVRERVQIETGIHRILTSTIGVLQTLGYMPRIKPQEPSNLSAPPRASLKQPVEVDHEVFRYALLAGGPEAASKVLRDPELPRDAEAEWQLRLGRSPVFELPERLRQEMQQEMSRGAAPRAAPNRRARRARRARQDSS